MCLRMNTLKAIAIIEGIENRGQLGDYAVERLMFN
ncbi:MAG: hypothetical protein RLZZ381_3374 [Cyanobacteriota bacterium]|jgi:hypothetical protein